MRLAEYRRRFSLPFHVVKRLDTPRKITILIRIISVLSAFLLAGVLCNIFRPGTFGIFYREMFLGCFNPANPDKFMEFLMTVALLMLVSFALAPAFKMKFWNIGGEGQILVGVLTTAAISRFMGNAGVDNSVIIILSLFASILAGVIWGVIPALFKAFFGTNETLFTLMMNYIAAGIILILINVWVPSGSQVFGDITTGIIPNLFNVKFLTSIILAAVVVTILIIYMKFTKHGYEIAVVGESRNTARYIGINVELVTIRTMIVSGGVCGIVGFLLVAGYHHTLTSTLAGGIGFTGVLIAWLGGFQPSQMIFFSFLVGFFTRGSFSAASEIRMSLVYFPNIVTGIFFLIVIACTFFLNYRVMFKHRIHEEKIELAAEGNGAEIENSQNIVIENKEKVEEVKEVKKPSKSRKKEDK